MNRLIWVHKPAHFWQTVVAGILVNAGSVQRVDGRAWGSRITFTNGDTLNVSETPLDIAEIISGKQHGAAG